MEMAQREAKWMIDGMKEMREHAVGKRKGIMRRNNLNSQR